MMFYRVIAGGGKLEHGQKEFHERFKMLWLLLIAIVGRH
jgi:hypothetical protein